ncbi:MAG TPA: hypothetical protein VJZ74_00715 [Pseudolabrys sp.]|nr:hypothetical protein [Pseudolabrys sp.]
MISLDSPATRADVLALLTRGARAGSVLRLLVSDLNQLTRGYSYTLRENGVPLGIAGFWPVEAPPPELAALAAGRPVYVLWLIAGDGLSRHMARVLRLAHGYIAALTAAGGVVIADLDGERESAAKLARLVGLVPRLTVQGHDLWASEREQTNGNRRKTFGRQGAADAAAGGAGG